MAKQFSVEEQVVYPGQGVGKITEISEKKFKEELLQYYVIFFEESDMTVLVPVFKSDELGIRTIVAVEEAERALLFLSEKCDAIPSDWKMRYQMNLDLFKSGSIMDNASIVRSLYHRSKVKELPIQERKLYDSAYRIFVDELSFSLQKGKQDIECMIHTHLEPLGVIDRKNHSMDNDTDIFDDEIDSEESDNDFDDA